jgi:23S rRNA pseudouridine1911/1915/1917 synthase
LENLLNIIHEDADLLIINKPAGLVCHPTKGDQYSSLISRARLYLEPQSAVPHLVHRLDRETSGVVVIARNPIAAGEFGKLLESRAVSKEYLAIVHGHITEPHGIIDAPLGRDEASEVAIKDCVRPDGASARTEFIVEKHFPDAPFTLVRLRPLTGRKHQLRIHLAHVGHPIVGDKLYGTDPDCYLAFVKDRLTDGQRAHLILPWQALHAARLQFTWRERLCDFTAPPEPWFAQFTGLNVRG